MPIERAQTLAEYIHACLELHSAHPFLAELDGPSLTYGKTRRRIEDIRRLFVRLGLKPGDRVALLGPNSINWCLIYLAAVTSGLVAVPILPDFNAVNVQNILLHSEARILFLAGSTLEKLEGARLPRLERALLLEDFQPVDLKDLPQLLRRLKEKITGLKEKAFEKLAEWIRGWDQKDHQPRPEDLAAIVYTSGTTGNSKGVMLTQRNLVEDIKSAVKFVEIDPRDRLLSLLPLAHTYECTCAFLAVMSGGVSITFMLQKPSPKLLLAAFAKVRPTIVFAVPLVIEKIYRKRVLNKIEGSFLLRTLARSRALRRMIHKSAVRRLLAAFGGRLRQMGFGGAPLNPEVEKFMRDGKFPYFTGYGMTECAPLITGCRLGEARAGSCGYPVENIELRIADPDPSGVGEVQVKGPMITPGYYKNPEATAALFTADGWLCTGDLGIQDSDGFLYLKGRSKNVILGPSGENIYPEEIEYLLNQSPSVLESLVVPREGRLVALIYPDYELLEREHRLHNRSEADASRWLGEHFRGLIAHANDQLPAFSRINEHRLVEGEFEKTPTQKIKRYLYL